MATDNKYDRQLRLWGTNGQKALSESCIVLFHPTAAGTESLKNLVLPGIGSFHIVDYGVRDGTDGGDSGEDGGVTPFSNFFVFPDREEEDPTSDKNGNGNGNNSNGNTTKIRSRAEIATIHLSELNPDVRGDFSNLPSFPREPAEIYELLNAIKTKHDVKWENLLILSADVPSALLKPLADFCWDCTASTSSIPNNCMSVPHIPMVICKSYGLMGYVRLQIPDHPIVESKRTSMNADLRLASSYPSHANNNSNDGGVFPELYKLVQKVKLEELDSQEHSHVPFVILLWKALDRWQTEKNKNNEKGSNVLLPETFDEKQEFKQLIKSMSRNFSQEINFSEACNFAYLAHTQLSLPWELESKVHNAKSILSKKINEQGAPPSKFDVLLSALQKFISTSEDGLPPLDGSIPDMQSSTSSFVQLQNVYKKRSELDRLRMRTILREMEDEFGRTTLPDVTEEDLSIFCKNIYNLRHVSTRKFSDEYDLVYDGGRGELEELVCDLPFDENAEQSPVLWYVALLACEKFWEEYGAYPGKDSRKMALGRDAVTVQGFIEGLVEKLNLGENEVVRSTLLCAAPDEDGGGSSSAYAKEVVRYYNAEIHNIASIVGGVASQESVKLITAQYVPMDGTYIFNGIASVMGVCKL